VRSLLTKFSGSFERSQNRPKPRAAARRSRGQGTGDTVSLVPDYREELAQTLQSLPAAGFERFCQRLLRESGFQEVTITGRSGDGGIDGIGMLQVNALVSFKVLFQCKKYAGSVTPSHVRDFRGAMTGRADKGIIITTGSFTSEARKEAVRDGAPPIELVDGEKLTGMLEKLELGLRPRQTFEVDAPFFEEYKK
jgi:restriction system protein